MATEFFCPQCSSPNPKDTVFCGKCGTRLVHDSPETPASDPLIGTFVGDRFLVHDKLGEGGMGVVYRAEQTAIKREVALKVLHSNLTQDESLFARFQNEAAACSRLNHPNTITIYDFGKTSQSSLYIAMEFIRGISLDDEIQNKGAMDVARACHIAIQVCGSLEDAHNNSIIHRDLKPENVMLCERAGETDVVKVLDFGIAKIMEDESQDQRKALTKTGMVFGTPQYMSPEQIRGEKVDNRTDIYSLGVMLYQMLTGALPFTAETPMGLLTKHLMDTPPPLEPHGVPAPVAAAVMASLEKEASARPQSMRDFGRMLSDAAGIARGTVQQVAAGPSATTVPQTAVVAPTSKKRPDSSAASAPEKKPFPVIFAVIAAVVLAGGGATAWYFTAGPGGTSGAPTSIQATAVPPQIPAGVPQVPTSIPSAPAPAAVVPTPEPLPAPDVTENAATPSTAPAKNRSGKNSGSTPKKPDKPNDDKITPDKPNDDKTTPDKPDDNNASEPAKEVACSFNSPKEASGKALANALKRKEKAIRNCAGQDGKLDTAFQFSIAENAVKVSGVSAVGGKGDSCVQAKLEGAVFKPQKESAKGIATVAISKSGGVIDSCSVKVRILPSVKNVKDLLKGTPK